MNDEHQGCQIFLAILTKIGENVPNNQNILSYIIPNVLKIDLMATKYNNLFPLQDP
jgi:hypothetical protein